MENTKDARAYPIAINGQAHNEWHYGLTKHEYAAIEMAKAICVNAGRNTHEFSKPEKIAETAIKVADALFEQLNKG